ncbi:MAG: hypothetical protein MJZ16_13400 [Bacteroidales bacterium]|nr:hypothetical protein [Bacteroidales bacterium]
MKKIIFILALCAMALCVTSCFKETPGLTMTPESVTLKVGQSVQLHPGTVGEGINFSDIKIINTEDGICFLDKTYMVTGLKVGTSRVGVGILNDKDDFSKGLKYRAYGVVKVVE